MRRRGGGGEGGGGAAAPCAPRLPEPSNDLPKAEEEVVEAVVVTRVEVLGDLAADACGKSVAANIAVATVALTATRRGVPRVFVVVVVIFVVVLERRDAKKCV